MFRRRSNLWPRKGRLWQIDWPEELRESLTSSISWARRKSVEEAIHDVLAPSGEATHLGISTTIRHEQLAIKGIPIAAATATISPPGALRSHGGHVVPGLDGPADERDSGPDEIFSLSSAERSQSSSSQHDVESRHSDSSALTPDEWSQSEGEIKSMSRWWRFYRH